MGALPGGVTCSGGSKSSAGSACFSSFATPERRRQRPPPVAEAGVDDKASNPPTSHTYWKTASVHTCLCLRLRSVRARFVIRVRPVFAFHEVLTPLRSSLLFFFARTLIPERSTNKHKWRWWRGERGEGAERVEKRSKRHTKKNQENMAKKPKQKKNKRKHETQQKERTARRTKEITRAESRWKGGRTWNTQQRHALTRFLV